MGQNIERREFLKAMGGGAAVLTAASCGLLKRRRWTNFVLILADDLGYADVGCFGAKGYETPNLDRLAAEGMRFTSFYVAQAVCSASRAGLLTGCYPNRIGILHALMPQAENGLSASDETIAEVLKKRGYICGIFGKWHLGHRREFLPLQHGFDEYFGLPYSNDMWPLGYDGKALPEGERKLRHPYPPLIDGNDKVGELRSLEDNDKLTALYTERAVRFIEKNRNRPFFLYVPHTMVHVPLGVSAKFRGRSEQGLYGDVMMEMDWSAGRIMEALKKYGLGRNTLVIFTSDNGPWLNFGSHAGSAGPLREGKGTVWEGGVRVPCIMHWPGRIKPGSVCDRLAATMDLLPTFAAIAGAPLSERRVDGINILPLLLGERDANPRTEFYYYYGKDLKAVRQGHWKLHLPHTDRTYEGFEPGRNGLPGPTGTVNVGFELYDLEKDVGERDNVYDQFPEAVKELMALAETARQDLGDGDRAGSGRRTSQ